MQFHTCGKLAVHVCVLLVCYMTSAYTTCQKFFSLLFPFIQIFRKKKKKRHMKDVQLDVSLATPPVGVQSKMVHCVWGGRYQRTHSYKIIII